MSNILGENHLPYVQEQIKVRQEILGKKQKSSQDIVWENGKTSWVRLVSSVNIDGEEVPRYDEATNEDYIEFYFGGALFREQYLELSSENYTGNRLASELTLSGGTPIDNKHRFGIAETNSTLPGIQNSQGNGSAAYGLGGTEFGIKPMPGITGFNSKTYDNGSLRMAEVTIVAHNKKQFEYLESLYLRVGYTMLLEWGNSSYPKSIENGVTTYSSTSDIASLSLKNDFLEGINKGVDYFYTQIEKNRKISKGNYDGFLGKVTNFSWNFDKNGSYNITLKLITVGSVIESLKVDTTTENFTSLDSEGNDNIDKFRPSTLGTYLDVIDFYPRFKPERVVTPRVGKPGDSNFVPQSVQDLNPNTALLEGTDNSATYKVNLTEIGKKALAGYQGTNNVGCRVGFGSEQTITKTYVRLGEFFNFINENLLIYRGDNPNFNSEENSSIKSPLISIDINENTYCFSNGYQFPSDPSKMLIRFENTTNPNSKDSINILPKLPKFHDKVNGVQVGRVMNLYYSTDYIRELIDLNIDSEEQKLQLLPLIKRIIESINSQLGGINKLKTRIVDKTILEGEEEVVKQVIEIYDEVQPFEKYKLFKNQTENPTLNVYGFSQNLSEGNFVTDYSFNTTIDKDFATQVAIGAQASGRAVGEDSTIFSKWNEGLVDRILPKKLDIDQVNKEGTSARVEFKNLSQEYKRLLELLIQTSYGPPLTEEEENSATTNVNKQSREFTDIFNFNNIYITSPSTDSPTENTPLFASSFSKIQNSFFTKALSWLALTKNSPTPFIGFLPVNLSLTFDGLSGIKIFDKLRVNSDFLPSNYTSTLEFIITQLDHKFENNKWFTTVGTLSIPKLFSDTDPSIALNLGELINEPFERDYNSLTESSYFYTDQSIVSGGNPGIVTIDQILKALNNSPEVQSKFQRFLDGLLKAIPNGFEIRINSSYRDFRDSNRVYASKAPLAENRVERAFKSPHTYGLALDIALYELVPGQPGSSTNLIAGKPKKYFEIWQDLGITDISNNIGLRWGGVFKQNIYEPGTGKVIGTKPYYDCVHFDAAPTPWPSNASIIFSSVKTLFPNIPLIILYGYKTNFRDFGLGESIYNVSFQNFLNISGNNYSINVPELIFRGNTDRRASINSVAREDIYKSILINGNYTYYDGGTKDIRNLLTNNAG